MKPVALFCDLFGSLWYASDLKKTVKKNVDNDEEKVAILPRRVIITPALYSLVLLLFVINVTTGI